MKTKEKPCELATLAKAHYEASVALTRIMRARNEAKVALVQLEGEVRVALIEERETHDAFVDYAS